MSSREAGGVWVCVLVCSGGSWVVIWCGVWMCFFVWSLGLGVVFWCGGWCIGVECGS